MDGTIILQGITLDQFRAILKEEIRAEINHNEAKRIAPLSKKQAYTMLGINPRTLDNYLSELGISTIYPSDIDRIFLAHPNLHKKAKLRA